MKRILTLLLILALSVSVLAGCDLIKKPCTEHVDADGNYVCDNCEAELEKPHEHSYDADGKCSCGELHPELVAVQDAAAYVRQLYKDDPKTTTEDFNLVAVVPVGDLTFKVVWTVDNDKITLTASPDGSSVIVDIPEITEESVEDISYTLTATITSENGYTDSRSFDRVVPKFKVNTWEDYANAEVGDPLMVDGIVVAISSVSTGAKRNHLFVMDAEGKGGYYNYGMEKDPIADLGIAVGMTVRISGEAQPYNGLPEFKNASVKILDETIKTFDFIDITDKFQKDTNYNHLVALPVVIKGVTLGTQDLETETSQYLYFELNGVKSYIRTYVTDFLSTLTKDDKATIDELHASKFGYKADVYGIMITYSNAPYIMPVSVECFTNFQLPDRTDAEKLAMELGAVSLPDAVVEDTVITLPTAGSTYDSVKFAWESDKDCAVVADGKLTVTLPSEKTTVTLTLTATIGETTETKTFEIAVDAASADLYVPKFVDTIKDGDTFKLAMYQAKLGKYLYFNGQTAGYYLGVTDKTADAADVHVEAVEGGFRFYSLDGETKNYIEIYQNGDYVNIKLTTEPTCVFVYDEDAKTYVVTIGEKNYYLGTYGDKTDIRCSATSYITGDNAANVGVSQHVAAFATLASADYAVEAVTPEAGKSFKLAMYQAKLGKYLYFNGQTAGYYLGVTDKTAEAADVYAEAVDGGLRFYVLDGETKNYIEIYQNGDYVNIKLTTEPTCVFVYDEDAKTYVVTIGEKNYYLGTYGDKTDIRCSATSYITGDNAANVGVSQHVAFSAELVLKEVAPKAADTIKDGDTFKLAMYQAKLGKYLYFNGQTAGYYLGVTDKLSQAADVHVEAVEGGFRFYVLDGETKNYIEIYQNGDYVNIKLTTEPTCVFVYDEDAKTYVVTIGEKNYYLGTYGDKTDIRCSATSYITGDNAANVGVSQHLAVLSTIEFVVEEEDDGNENEGTEGGETTDTPTCTHVDANNDYKCDNENCTEFVLPAANSTLTIEEALKITALYISNEWSGHYTTNKYYVTGTVLSVVDASKGNLVIVDANGNELPLNSLKNADGTVSYADMTNKPIKGDTITVYGVIGAYGQNIQLYEGCTTVHTAHEHNNVAATCTAGQKCSICGTVTGTGTGHSDANSDNICDAENCGVVLNAVAESLNIFANAGTLSADSLSISWASTNFTCVGEKAKSTTAIRTSDSDHYRIYANSKFTVSAVDGKKISKVVLTVTEAKYASILAQSLTTAGASASYEGTVVTVTIDLGTLESISFTASAQTRVAKVDVYCQ